MARGLCRSGKSLEHARGAGGYLSTEQSLEVILKLVLLEWSLKDLGRTLEGPGNDPCQLCPELLLTFFAGM